MGLGTRDKATDTRKQREAFQRARRAERTYATQLRKVARQIGELVEKSEVTNQVRGNYEFSIGAMPGLTRTLELYGAAITPWANATAKRMLLEVGRRDESAWTSLAEQMGIALKDEVKNAPTGVLFAKLMAEQVDLITSLPREAGVRVHELVINGMSAGGRAKDIHASIMASGEVTAARAALIARTEVGRAATGFTMARAVHIGSKGYVWRTAGDADVRPAHKKLEGTFHKWDDPPVSGENGERAHAGAIYNCRCYAEPIIPRDI